MSRPRRVLLFTFSVRFVAHISKFIGWGLWAILNSCSSLKTAGRAANDQYCANNGVTHMMGCKLGRHG